jgi:plasmid stabilization system protein ParE
MTTDPAAPELTGDVSDPVDEVTREDGEVTVAFESPFFTKLSAAYFRIAESSGDPVLMVEYGEQFVALPLPGIRRELGLAADAADAKMLDLVVKALSFVNVVSIGDPLPSEIISGKASWALTPQHAQIAYQRMAIKLLAWMTGGKTDAPSSAEDIVKQFQDPDTRKKVADAFGQAAEALGLGRDRREEVTTYLESLAQELGYIEALRDKFQRIVRIGRRLKEMADLSKKSLRVADVITQGSQLMRPAVEQFVGLFKEADALTADIMGVLKNLDATIAAIRAHRDDIYQRMTPWNELLEAWEKCKEMEISGETTQLAARTVRMLAPRFMPSKEWELRFKEDKNKKHAVKSWRSPEQQRNDMKKVLGNVMRW